MRIAMPAAVPACASPSEIPGDPLQQPPSGRATAVGTRRTAVKACPRKRRNHIGSHLPEGLPSGVCELGRTTFCFRFVGEITRQACTEMRLHLHVSWNSLETSESRIVGAPWNMVFCKCDAM